MQYSEFDWKVLKTEHFDIYYYNEFEEMAEIGASYAEEAYADLKVKFNFVVTRKIPLIFYNTHLHFQQTNTTPGFIPEGVGGFFEFLKGRVVIPYLGSLDQFRHVIRHELVHVFMTTKLYRVLADHRIPTDRYPPLWFIEGLAEYWSTTWDTQAEMVMRDAVTNGYFVGLRNFYQIFGTFLMYKEGQNFLEFAARQYGEEKILLLIDNFWKFTSFNDLMEYVFDKSIDEIDREWLYFLKQKYFPLLSDRMPPENAAKKLTGFGFYFSPSLYVENGKKYIYTVGNRDGYSSVFKLELKPDVKDKDRPDPEVVVRGEKEEKFEAFHLLESSLDVSGQGNVAFVTKSGGTDVLHVYSVNRDEIVTTLKNPDLISISAPSWSRKGDKLLFQAIDQKGYSDIFYYDYPEGILHRVTNDYYSDEDPVFGKGDSTIVFASDRTAGTRIRNRNLFEYHLSNNSINYLTYADADFRSPRFSQDYNALYFGSDYDGIHNIWKLDRDSSGNVSGMTKVTNFLTSIFGFTFVDNHTVVASAFENFSFQLYYTDFDKMPDSLRKFVPFDFNVSARKWVAPKIVLGSQKDKVKYENEYTLDYAQSQVSTDPVFGTQGGAIFSLSDLFGDDNYFFLIYNTAEVQSEFLKSFNVAISRINIGNRTNYAYGLFNFSGRRYDIRESDEYFYERSYGGYFSMIYPLSTFKRIEATVSVANSDKELFAGIMERKALLLTNSVAYVSDNSLWGPTGPLDGHRFRFSLAFTSDVKYSNVNYYSLGLDYRHYFRLSLRSSFAMRTAVFYNEGKEARRYFMGGSWDLRGWPRWSIRGEKMWLSSFELRFPLIDLVALRFPILDLFFPNIRGALFFDSGNAWDTDYEETLGSVGAGVRINIFNILTLRYDMGKKIENNFGDFQKGLFYQFFFGWDF